MKRFLDVILSFSALLVLSPFLLPVVVVLRFTGEGEVFYIQERAGREGNSFGLYKFATMLKNSPNIGAGEITIRGDPRVLPFGKFLRKTKLNELPQIINILRGDISLVGPRPLVTKTFKAYNEEVQSKIYRVKPGLTGIGSIVFSDDELINSAVIDESPHEFYKRVIAPYKGELEMWYQEHNSFFLDLQLIFMTAWVILVPTSKLYEKWFKDLPKRSF